MPLIYEPRSKTVLNTQGIYIKAGGVSQRDRDFESREVSRYS